MTDYIDVRVITPGYTTIPCKECSEDFFVQNSFAYNHDTWYCDECLPEDLRNIHRPLRVEVNV